MLTFKGKKRELLKKLFQIEKKKKMSENINDTETEYATIEDPLSLHRTSSNVTCVISEIRNIIIEENVILHQGK